MLNLFYEYHINIWEGIVPIMSKILVITLLQKTIQTKVDISHPSLGTSIDEIVLTRTKFNKKQLTHDELTTYLCKY